MKWLSFPLSVSATDLLFHSLRAALAVSMLAAVDRPLAQTNGEPPPASASLVIRRPVAGAVFVAPARVMVEAVAVDPTGDIRHVEFFANGDLIGQSDHWTRDAIIPGRPREHVFEWANVAAGEYRIVARAKDMAGALVESAPVNIGVRVETADGALIPAAAEWRYFHGVAGPAADWTQVDFGDAEWRVGRAQLGYGDGDEATRLEFPSTGERPITAYFRRSFEVADPAAFQTLIVRLLRDDGAVVYLNGQPIARSNMPDGPIQPSTLAVAAVGGSDESAFREIMVPAAGLVAGRNVLAAEVHQVNVSSSDLSFALELRGSSNPVPPEGPVVSIKATYEATSELIPTALIRPGVFRISRTGPAGASLAVSLAYEGTATLGTDYETLPESALIPEGASFIELTVLAKGDELVEGPEVVVARLTEPALPANSSPTPPYRIDPASSSARIVIHDADSTTSRPIVSIEATVPETSEPAPNVRVQPGVFVVKRTGSTAEPLTVTLGFDGTATAGIDYQTIDRTVTFAAGAAEVSLHVAALDDQLVEGAETVIAVLTVPATLAILPYEIAPDRRSARVTIHDNEEASAATLVITEPVEGQTYRAGSVISIKATAIDPNGYIARVEFYDRDRKLGSSEIAFFRAPEPGTPIDHTFEWHNAAPGEHALTARALDSNGNAVLSPRVGILVHDEVVSTPVVRVTAEDPEATELSPLIDAIDPARFVISRTGDLSVDLIVFFSYFGSAPAGSDFPATLSPLTIPAGQASVGIDIIPVSEEDGEKMETVGIQLLPSPSMGPRAPYTIGREQAAAVAVIYELEAPAEGALDLAIPLREGPFAPGELIPLFAAGYHPSADVTTVDFYAGSDKIASSSVVFDKLTSGGLVLHHVVWEHAPAGSHSITARATLADGTQLVSGAVTVAVAGEIARPIVSVRFVEHQTLEPWPDADFAPGSLEISRTGAMDEPLTVYYNVDGTATPEVDYARLPGSITIPAGAPSSSLRLEAKDDLVYEGPETVVLILTQSPLTIDPPQSGGYAIDLEHRSAAITILDNDDPAGSFQVVLAIEAADSSASESGSDPGVFRIKRVAGPANVEVSVQYRIDGTAQNGVDYEELNGVLTLAAGAAAAELVVRPIGDDTAESEESVVVALVHPVCVAIAPPPPECYGIGQPAVARVIIRDGAHDGNHAPFVKVVQPRDGSVFSPGQAVEIRVEASDADGTVQKIELFGDEQLLESANAGTLSFRWTGLAAGSHTLLAKATDNSGAVANSAAVRVLLRELHPEAFVERDLPAEYAPNASFAVTLKASPPGGTSAYAVEDQPPSEWHVSEISHEGAFDPATRKVKFGPFMDAEPRLLTYSLTPPAGALGRREFGGLSSANGVAYPIGGDRIIESTQSSHPADRNADNAIAQLELTAYAATWKEGGEWAVGPNPIPLAYVTRAGLLWKAGERYMYDANQGPPPLSWVAAAVVPVTLQSGSAQAQRTSTGTAEPGGPLQVQISVTLPHAAAAYAVEEVLPEGWTVSGISHEGRFEPSTSCIRWGLFLDSSPRTLAYTVTPPANVASHGSMKGALSVDGALAPIAGTEQVLAANAATALRLPKLEKQADGRMRLRISGPAGQLCVLETSSDLKNWVPLEATLFLPDGDLEYVDEDTNPQEVRYYRTRVR